MEIKRLHVGKRLSETAIHNGTVYLAGQIAEDTSQDIVGQTREVLGHVDRLLGEAGSDKTRILMLPDLHLRHGPLRRHERSLGQPGSCRATRRRAPPSKPSWPIPPAWSRS